MQEENHQKRKEKEEKKKKKKEEEEKKDEEKKKDEEEKQQQEKEEQKLINRFNRLMPTTQKYTPNETTANENQTKSQYYGGLESIRIPNDVAGTQNL